MPRKNSVVEGDGQPGRMPPRMGAAQRAPGLKGYATVRRPRTNELRGGFRRENQYPDREKVFNCGAACQTARDPEGTRVYRRKRRVANRPDPEGTPANLP